MKSEMVKRNMKGDNSDEEYGRWALWRGIWKDRRNIEGEGHKKEIRKEKMMKRIWKERKVKRNMKGEMVMRNMKGRRWRVIWKLEEEYERIDDKDNYERRGKVKRKLHLTICFRSTRSHFRVARK
jgi:hypothetical protein